MDLRCQGFFEGAKAHQSGCGVLAHPLLYNTQSPAGDVLVRPLRRVRQDLAVNPALGLHPISTGGYDFLPDRGIGYFWELLPN
jgi:hypothetical protein